jgi:hypothetical protein
MTRTFSLFLLLLGIALKAPSQNLKEKDVPVPVRAALAKQYPEATHVSWEKEKGDFEANWGGRSGEDHSALFTPAGEFRELVDAMPVDQLPAIVISYVHEHYPGTRIREAGKVTDARGSHSFEVEIKGKDLIFDGQGHFLKED